LAHIPEGYSRDRKFKQVWFPGSHHDLGRDHVDGGGLLTCVLAWMVSELVEIGIPFKDEALRKRFTRFGQEIPIDQTGLKGHNWLNDPVRHSKSGIWRLTGHQQRTPGQYSMPGMRTDEAIHITARLRKFDRTVGNEAVPGYTYASSPANPNTWIQSGSWKAQGTGLRDRRILIEAPISTVEAALLGLALPATREPPVRLGQDQDSTLPARSSAPVTGDIYANSQTAPLLEDGLEEAVEPAARPALQSATTRAVENNIGGASTILGTDEPREEPSGEST
jgi:hypothetical protein